jgi:protein-disulfide isomerase
MTHTNLVRILGTIGTLSWLCLVGCDKKPATDSPSQDSTAKSSEPSGNPCGSLTDKLCGELGKESSGCEAAKVTIELLSDGACTAGLKDFETTKNKLKKQGKKCDELVEKLCAGVGPDTDSCKLVKEKTREMPPTECASMLDHTDEVIKELKQQEKANLPLDAAAQSKLTVGDVPAFGPANAKVTLVEFSDFQCPYCSRAAAVTSQIKEKYGTRIRFIFRQFPLPFHQNAQGAAQAALAAHAQGRFWEFHDKMFQNQETLERTALEGYAKDLGLDVAKFKAALDSSQTAEQVKADVALGNEVAVEGTPTLFINGKRTSNPTDFAEVSKEIESALGN